MSHVLNFIMHLTSLTSSIGGETRDDTSEIIRNLQTHLWNPVLVLTS